MFETEEDLKTKLLLPFLNDLGILPEEVVCERSFRIKLGLKSHEIRSAGGRLDVLCRRDQQNLFVIEVKSESEELTDDDADQGISYARLVHPIAPFVLLTNGRETRCFDTITKAPITGTRLSESRFWQSGCTVAVDEELSARYEALRCFIAISADSLRAFSEAQIRSRMQSVRSDAETGAKYVPSLFVPRESIRDSFRAFLSSDHRCFALIGESGVGKTNYLCALTEESASQHVSLFYLGAELGSDLMDAIKEDYAWFFPARLDAPQLFQRLSSLCDRARCSVVIFVDAIDEVPHSDFPSNLNEFVRRTEGFPQIKLCITCKSAEWGSYLRDRSYPTHLSRAVFRGGRDDPGIRVERFDDHQMPQIEERYRTLFRFKGNLSGPLRAECRLGFLLRALSETYAGESLPGDVDEPALMAAYLDRKLSQLSNSEQARELLIGLGNALLEETTGGPRQLRGLVQESTLKTRLGLSPLDVIPPELLSYNILRRIVWQDRFYVGFYHDYFRDFIVAHLSLQLGQMDVPTFRSTLSRLTQSPVGQRAIAWYAKRATSDHRAILLEHWQSRALLFVSEYERIIHGDLPALRQVFEPHTSGAIGLEMTDPTETEMEYRFCEIPEHGDLVSLVGAPATDLDRCVGDWGSRFPDFRDAPPEGMARWEVRSQLEKIITGGLLDESHSEVLSTEKVLAISASYGDKLGFPSVIQDCVPHYEAMLPLDLADLRSKVTLILARKHCEDLHIKKALDEGRIQVQRSGGTISYQPWRDLTASDRDEIERAAREAVAAGREIPRKNIGGDYPPWYVLLDTIDVLLAKGRTVITEPVLPGPDIALDARTRAGAGSSIPDLIIAQYGEERLRSYIETYFTIYVEEYMRLVDRCFPTFKEKLEFYALQPMSVYVEATPGQPDSLVTGYRYHQERFSVKAHISPATSKRTTWREEFDASGLSGVGSLFWNQDVRFPGRQEIGKAERYCTIRNAVYKRIRRDQKAITEAL